MKCPNCGKSLWFVQTACPFCGASLAPSPVPAAGLPAAASTKVPEEKADLATLVQCANLSEADAVRTHLESAGITAFLPEEATTQTLALKLDSFIRVQVHARDLAAAQKALENLPVLPPTMPLAEQPLTFPEKWGAFFLGAGQWLCIGWILFFFMRSGFVRQGYTRKARQVIYWFIAGVPIPILLYALVAWAGNR